MTICIQHRQLDVWIDLDISFFGDTCINAFGVWGGEATPKAVTAFGQTCFGHPYLAAFGHIWPKLIGRIWPSLFGRIWPIFVDRIWPDRIWPIFCLVRARKGGQRGGRRNSGSPKSGGPEGVGAFRGGGPNP